MTKQEFEKFLNQAVKICEDYQTTTVESDAVVLLWFTPKQLMTYTEYCMKKFNSQKSNQ